jgi:hypothetical protein
LHPNLSPLAITVTEKETIRAEARPFKPLRKPRIALRITDIMLSVPRLHGLDAGASQPGKGLTTDTLWILRPAKPMSDQYTFKQYAYQLRKFLKMGPQLADHGSADLAETLVKRIVEQTPPGTPTARHASELIEDVRGWFMGKAPQTPEGAGARRRELMVKVMALEREADQYDDGAPR